jgi:hypothetical protein
MGEPDKLARNGQKRPPGGHSSLTSAATNPFAKLIQFQLQDQYAWDNYNSSGYFHGFLIQPVVPDKLPFEKVPPLITRTTTPSEQPG